MLATFELNKELFLISSMERGNLFRNKNNHVEHYHKEEHHVNEKVPNHNKILTSLISGAAAGAVAKTTIAPLDRAKINFQIKDTPYTFKGLCNFLKNTVINEKWHTLWRGNSATMARIVPYAALQYASHEQFKNILKIENKKHLPPFRRILAGSLAGITSVTFTYPLDLVRARMAVTAKDRYHHISEVVSKIWKEEGILILYRGFTPTILGVIPYSGISFFTYETCKKKHADWTKGSDLPPYWRLLFGALAGLLGQSASYPLDIVRRRMQTAGVTGHSHDYTGIVSTLKNVIKEEGFRQGLYKGLSLNWIKGPIAVGVSFTTFDITNHWIRKWPVLQYDDVT